MSSGRTHRAMTLAIAPLTACAAGVASRSIPAAFVVGLGGLLTVFVNPDLDQEGISASEWDIVQFFGLFGGIGHMWMAYWHPYAWAIPHRSPWSHLPAFGTLVRFLYLAPLVFVLVSPFVDLSVMVGSVSFWRVAGWLFIGAAVCDAGHCVADIVADIWKRRRQRPRRRRHRRRL